MVHRTDLGVYRTWGGPVSTPEHAIIVDRHHLRPHRPTGRFQRTPDYMLKLCGVYQGAIAGHVRNLLPRACVRATIASGWPAKAAPPGWYPAFIYSIASKGCLVSEIWVVFRVWRENPLFCGNSSLNLCAAATHLSCCLESPLAPFP